jgi:O-antigen/teichoic acid export membrane protein
MRSGGAIGRIAAQGASVAVTRLVLIGVALLGTIVIARALPVEERGRFGLMAASAALCIQFGSLGLANVNTYLVARRPELLGAVVGNSVRLLGVVLPVLMALVSLGIWLLPSLATLRNAAGLATCFMITAGICQLMLQNLLVGRSLFAVYNWVDVLARGGAITGMAVLWMAGQGTAVGFGWVTAILSFAALGWGMRAGMIPLKANTWNPELARWQLRLGARAYLSNVALFMLGRLPIYVVEVRAGLHEVAYFAQAWIVTEAMLVLPGAIGTVLVPNLAGMADASARIASTWRVMGGTAVFALMAAAAAAIAGPWLLPQIYGPAYSASAPYLLAMLPGVVAQSVASVLQNALSANGFPWSVAVGPLVGVLAVALVLFFSHDPLACAWAYTGGAVAMLGGTSVAWRRTWHRPVEPDLALARLTGEAAR